MTQIRLLPPSDEPGTHVLIIGVGYYQHLRGGPNTQDGVHMGLGVLESPPTSAIGLAHWMLGDHAAGGGLNNPSAPLTTLDILISSRQGEQLDVAGVSYAIERASLQQVQNGFDRWLAEVQRNPNSVGVLYFCGHGVMGNGPEHILLLDDYGANRNRAFQTGSFDLSNTLRALWRQVSAQLYVFIDACRTYDRHVSDLMGARPAPLLGDSASSANINCGTTWIESTGEGLPAYGDVNGVSRFTEALLQALDGYCGTPQPGTPIWLVNGSTLAQAVPKLLAIVNKDRGGKPQACTPHLSGSVDATLHQTTQVPKVKVEIELSPETLQVLSRYEINNLLDVMAPPITGGQVAGIWRTEAYRGVYKIRIESTKPYTIDAQFFDPPHYHLPVEVQL